MKLTYLLILLLYIIFEIESRNDRKRRKRRRKDDNDNLKEEDDDNAIMSDEEFQQKLGKILEEKKIEKNQKITKEILKNVFDDLYNKEFNLPDLPDDNSAGLDIDPKDETRRFMDEIFGKLTKGLDYDDEINVSDINEYISPKKVRESVNEIIENLVGMMGGLGRGDL